MLGNWLRRKVQTSTVKAAQEDLERFVASLRGASDEELGTLVAVATLIRLRLTEIGSLPRDPFVLPSPGDDLARVPLHLSSLVREFQKMGQPSDAAGTMVWLHSMRALALPEVRHLGRQMWKELQRGFPRAPGALNEVEALTGEEVPAEARDACTFIPEALVPFSAEHEKVLGRRVPNHSVSEADEVVRQLIEAAKLVGATTAREAAEITMARPLPDDEWEHYREAWDRNWG